MTKVPDGMIEMMNNSGKTLLIHEGKEWKIERFMKLGYLQVVPEIVEEVKKDGSPKRDDKSDSESKAPRKRRNS